MPYPTLESVIFCGRKRRETESDEPFWQVVARQFTRIVAALPTGARRVPILGALVAATAIVGQIPVVTQDDDYDAILGAQVIGV